MKNSVSFHLSFLVLCIAPWVRAQDAVTEHPEPATEAGQPGESDRQTVSAAPGALESQLELPAPYETWTGNPGFPAPRPHSRRPAQGPLTPELELARSALELVAGVGPVFGWCFGGSAMSFPCRALDPGLAANVSGLWRVTPFFAWGGRIGTSWFADEPSEELEANRKRTLLGALEVVARVYTSDEGAIDPYAELGMGAALLRASFSGGPGADFVDSAYAPSAHVGGGLDFVLGRHAKLGLAVSLNQLFVAGLRRCPAHEEGPCQDVPGLARGYVSSTLEVGSRFTLMLGNEL